ncbi:TetR/AcrR family transcriptional regulator [Streptomyces phaeoluteigriseus]|uniref:TetR/AcrR family transcriptional regulator n=1 Tax=Streptomyces phaeoluteigriseus TaxID=114686 RepID=UPI001FE9D1E6|nr:TetR/AcrR family transcriptional regulator [Streptomyces phaeoluteigriseus]
MSPRSASVNEELRRRSRERFLQAAVELVSERGYEATTLGDIADRAGSARGLVSYYFPGKRQLVQSAVHRLMHRTLEEALEREPRTGDGRERMARAVDAILGLARDRTVLMRQHMAGLLQAEGFVQCPEQRRLAELLRDTVARHGSRDVDTDYPMLRSLLMGAVYAMVLPNVGMPLAPLRAELFARYRLDWGQGLPPDTEAPGGTRDTDFSRFFATGRPAPDQPRTADEPRPATRRRPCDQPPEPADEPQAVDQSK